MIKKYFLQRKTNQLLKQDLANGDYNKKVIFLIDEAKFNQQKLKTSFFSVFTDSYELSFVHFTDKKKIKKSNPEEFIASSDFSFFGKLNNQALLDTINQEVELLFHFYESPHVFLDYLSTLVKANIRIGMNNFDERFIHFQLNQPEENWSLFFKEVHKYIQIIKSA